MQERLLQLLLKADRLLLNRLLLDLLAISFVNALAQVFTGLNVGRLSD